MARFVHEVHMRWSDMDAYRHVNNSVYLTYLEQGRVAFFQGRVERTLHAGIVVRRHEIDYLQPIKYHLEPLRIEMWVGEVRAASFTVHYDVLTRGVLAARAQTLCVPFDFTTDRIKRLTAAEREALGEFADEQAAVP